jgi:hypothetical protein
MQQVNFFQNEFKRIDPPYSAAVLVIVLSYSLAVCLLVSIVLIYLSQSVSADLSKNKAQLNKLNTQLVITKKEYPAPKVDGNLLAQLEILKLRKDKNKKVLKYLETREMDISQQSFSGMMNGLSQIQQKNLWLTQVEILNGGQEVKLTGSTLSAAALPEYLKKLATVPSFFEMEFEVFDMTRNNNGLDFVVSSKRDKDDSKDKLQTISKNL